LSFLTPWRGRHGQPGSCRYVSVVEVFKPGGESLFLPVQQHELQEAREVVQVLAGVVLVHDAGGFRNLAATVFQIRGRTVAEDHGRPDVIGAAAGAFCFHQFREDAGGSKVAMSLDESRP
jgi:hypothetical protein